MFTYVYIYIYIYIYIGNPPRGGCFFRYFAREKVVNVLTPAAGLFLTQLSFEKIFQTQ